jgi:hypothetical protein
MNKCWFFTHIFTGILIFKGLTARCLYKSFGIKRVKEHESEFPTEWLNLSQTAIFNTGIAKNSTPLGC